MTDANIIRLMKIHSVTTSSDSLKRHLLPLTGCFLFHLERISWNLETRGNSDGSIEEFWELCCSVPGSGHGAFDYEFNPDRPKTEFLTVFLSGFDPSYLRAIRDQWMERAETPQNNYRHGFQQSNDCGKEKIFMGK